MFYVLNSKSLYSFINKTYSDFSNKKMRANFALKSGRDEWTRTTDPHLIRKVYVFEWVYTHCLECP